MGLARVFAEAVIQGNLQVSLLMARNQSLIQQPTVLISVVLSCTTIAMKGLGMSEATVAFAFQPVEAQQRIFKVLSVGILR